MAKTKKKPVAKKKPAARAQAKVVKKAKPAARPAARPAAKKPATQPKKPAVAAKPQSPSPKPAPVAHKPASKPQAAPAQPKPVKPQPAAPVLAKPAPAPAPLAPRRLSFKVNELVVYPAHGVGRVVKIEEQEIAGAKLELYIIDFEKEKLRLKVPTNKADAKGMRRLADKALIEQAMRVLNGRARIKRTMWSRRAQEYGAKINSGDLISVAEVVRDLYRSERQTEQSYSERQLFEQALERMARELAAVRKVDDDVAIKDLEDYLAKNAHRAVKTEEPMVADAAA